MTLFPAEPVLTRPVVGPDGGPWSPDPHADVLLMARELTSGDWRLVDLAPASDEPAGTRHRPERGVPARGFVVWESNRSGDWRLWTRRLEGSPARPLSPEEPERQHCCAHVSPGWVSTSST